MSDASNIIAAGKVVSIHYKLTVGGAEVDSSEGGNPLEYLHGSQNIVPGLERQLEGKSVGDSVQATVAPVDGYGERNEEAVQTVPRSAFPPDAELSKGLSFQAMDEDQNPMIGTILELTDETVTVDFNHPLAGQQLEFDVNVEAIRDASDQEREHGHAHGPGGHDH